MFRTLALAAAVAVSATGCYQVSMADGVDVDFDFFQLVGPSDSLHSPYVQGASIDIWIRSTDKNQHMQGWTLSSSDATVFSIHESSVDDYGLNASCTAVGRGSADLTVKDEQGRQVISRNVRVELPDHAQVLAHGPLLLGRPDTEALLDEGRVVAGGTATFLVRWFRGTEELAGNGVLSTQASTNLAPVAETTSFLEQREWLKVTTKAAAPSEPISLFADGHLVGTFPVVAVAATEIAQIAIAGQNEATAREGQWLTALAQSSDSSQRAVYGVEYSWQVDGVTEQALGDLYRYEYKPKQMRTLAAHFSDHVATATIHAGNGYVDSSNNVGCSLSGSPRASAVTLTFVAFALLLARRRAVYVAQRTR